MLQLFHPDDLKLLKDSEFKHLSYPRVRDTFEDDLNVKDVSWLESSLIHL